MYIVIVGAGNVGYGLALELVAHSEHEVLLVESDRTRANLLREELGELAVAGDGTEVRFLEQVGAARADLFIAVTGNDGANLVACQIAHHHFHVPRTIARVNDPRNEHLFRLLGIEATVSAASAVLAQIEVDLPGHTLIPLMHLRESGLEVVDLHILDGSPAAGVALRDLPLPDDCLVSLVVTGHRARIPDGNTVLQPGDEIIAVIAADAEADMRALIAEPDGDTDGHAPPGDRP